MAIGGSLSPGGSYGRIQVTLHWVQDNWQHFDSWCCVKGIDPMDLPAYRFCNLAMTAIREDLYDADPDIQARQLESLEETLITCDEIEHPLMRLGKKYREANEKVSEDQAQDQSKSQPQASPESRHKYIPPWYKGEEAAYKAAKIAQAEISTLG